MDDILLLHPTTRVYMDWDIAQCVASLQARTTPKRLQTSLRHALKYRMANLQIVLPALSGAVRTRVLSAIGKCELALYPKAEQITGRIIPVETPTLAAIWPQRG